MRKDYEKSYPRLFSFTFSKSVYFINISIELIAVCLAGKNKEDDYEFSKINKIAVKLAHRRQGIAESLIKRTLTILKYISLATKLDASVGNAADGLYYKMGFFPGVQMVAMYKKSQW